MVKLKDGCDVNEAITIAISVLEVCLIVGTFEGKIFENSIIISIFGSY